MNALTIWEPIWVNHDTVELHADWTELHACVKKLPILLGILVNALTIWEPIWLNHWPAAFHALWMACHA